jgi:hypothetical protein
LLEIAFDVKVFAQGDTSAYLWLYVVFYFELQLTTDFRLLKCDS